jgi:hypothetical protein
VKKREPRKRKEWKSRPALLSGKVVQPKRALTGKPLVSLEIQRLASHSNSSATSSTTQKKRRRKELERASPP